MYYRNKRTIFLKKMFFERRTMRQNVLSKGLRTDILAKKCISPAKLDLPIPPARAIQQFSDTVLNKAEAEIAVFRLDAL